MLIVPFLPVCRYEDFADTPVETAKQMYEDIKMSVPRSVVEWLKRNTRSSHNGSEFQVFISFCQLH